MNKERIIAIAEWLETGAIHLGEDGNLIGFDMEYWNYDLTKHDTVRPDFPNECGTAMCIGGSAEQFFGSPEDKGAFLSEPKEDSYKAETYAAHLLGLEFDLAYKLFYPWGTDWYEEGGNQPMTPEYMAGVLRRLVDTGELVG